MTFSESTLRLDRKARKATAMGKKRFLEQKDEDDLRFLQQEEEEIVLRNRNRLMRKER